MNIIQAQITDSEIVREIARKTITGIYPHYYPAGTVTFFLRHHSDESISEDISAGRVYLLYNDENAAAGTVTIKDNEICRLFVLPEYQGMGYGKELIVFAETEIGRSYDEIALDASLPAKGIYLKRGYRTAEYHDIKTLFGDHLCYEVMKKRIEK